LDGVLTLAVVAEAHPGLAEADGVLASADTVKRLELALLDILADISARFGRRVH